MTLFNTIDIATGFCDAYLAYILFDAFLEKRPDISKKMYLLCVTILGICINISNHFFGSNLINVIVMLLLYLSFSLLYKSQIGKLLLFSSLIICIFACVEIIALFGLMLAENKTALQITDSPYDRVLGIIISKAVSFLVAKIIHAITKRKKSTLGTSYWILFISVVTTVLLSVFLICRLQDNVNDVSMQNLSLLSCIGLLIGMFLIIFLYQRMSEQAEAVNNEKLLKQQLQSQTKHFDEITLAQKQLKSVRHDLKNHVISIHSFIQKNEKNECEEYLKNLSNEIESRKSMIDTANTVLDSIIFTKQNIAEIKNIRFTENIIIPERLTLEPIDCCIILGNALDNAIEACDRLKNDSDKFINFSLIYDNSSLLCKIENPATTKENKKLTTTKLDSLNHGIGINNIKRTLKKYDHIFETTNKDGLFTFKFIIYSK